MRICGLGFMSFLKNGYCRTSSSQEWLLQAIKSSGQLMCIPEDLALFLLHECAKLEDVELSRRVESLIVYSGLDSSVILNNHLIRLYVACESLFEANQAFSNVSNPDQKTWGAIIEAHSKLGKGNMVVSLHKAMQHQGKEPDIFSFLHILKACGSTGAMDLGRSIHHQIVEIGIQLDAVIGSAIVHMYAKCGSLEEARGVFHDLPYQSVIIWDAMIAGCCQHSKDYGFALECFGNMWRAGIRPSQVTILNVSKVCSSLPALELGRYIHEMSFGTCFESDIILGNALVQMYVKFGRLDEARRVIDKLPDRSVTTWNAMMIGYVQNEKGKLALQYFEKMQHDCIKPNRVTFSSIIKACGSIGAIEHGRCIHEKVIEYKLQNQIVVGSSLVGMYAKCGSLEEACQIFEKLLDRNDITWNAMIGGYAKLGEGWRALKCFVDMQQEGRKPTKITILNVCKACNIICAIEQGRAVHELIIAVGLHHDVDVGNTLVDMYAKCGSLDEAWRVFDKLPNRDVISWNAMIAGYFQHGEDCLALDCFENMQHEGLKPDVVTWGSMIGGYAEHGEGLLALQCFENMQQEGVRPNKVIYLSILKACGSVGAIDKGTYIHKQIIEHDLHFDILVGNSLLDMYANCGNLETAREVFDRLIYPNIVSWGAMISGYAQLGESKLALQCFEDMQCKSTRPNKIVFTNILTALSRAGLVDEGLHFFKIMKEQHGVEDNLCHVTCMIDLLGRAGYFNDIMDLLKTNVKVDICFWMTLLSSCRMHCNVELGSLCFAEIVHIDLHCAEAYVLMSIIYANAQMMNGLSKVEMLRAQACLQRNNYKKGQPTYADIL